MFGPLRFVRDSSLRVAWDPVFVNVLCFNCAQLKKDQVFFSAECSEKISLCEEFLDALTVRMDSTVVGFEGRRNLDPHDCLHELKWKD